MKTTVAISTIIVLLILIGIRYYTHSEGAPTSPEFITTTCKKNPGILENVSMEIQYEVIEDPKILSIAREFIKANLPVPADLNNKPPTDWLNTNISVLKIIIKIYNDNSIPVYYETNAYCGTSYWGNNTSNNTIFDWRIYHPIATLRINAHTGSVFPVSIVCTLDFGYEKVLPNSVVTNEYYFVVTKPFKGKISASATVCLKPFCNICRVFDRSIIVAISDNK